MDSPVTSCAGAAESGIARWEASPDLIARGDFEVSRPMSTPSTGLSPMDPPHLGEVLTDSAETSSHSSCGEKRLTSTSKKRDRRRTPEPFGSGRPARRRSSWSSATRRGASTTTSGWSGTARWRAGRSPRASRWSRGSSTWPSTSRITRSSTADFEGEIPAGEYGAGTVEIWDRGTYELVEEKKNGGLTVRLHGERLEGPGRSFPPGSRASRRTGCSSASATKTAPLPARGASTRR